MGIQTRSVTDLESTFAVVNPLSDEEQERMAMKIAGYFVTDKLLLEHGITEL